MCHDILYRVGEPYALGGRAVRSLVSSVYAKNTGFLAWYAPLAVLGGLGAAAACDWHCEGPASLVEAFVGSRSLSNSVPDTCSDPAWDGHRVRSREMGGAGAKIAPCPGVRISLSWFDCSISGMGQVSGLRIWRKK